MKVKGVSAFAKIRTHKGIVVGRCRTYHWRLDAFKLHVRNEISTTTKFEEIQNESKAKYIN